MIQCGSVLNDSVDRYLTIGLESVGVAHVQRKPLNAECFREVSHPDIPHDTLSSSSGGDHMAVGFNLHVKFLPPGISEFLQCGRSVTDSSRRPVSPAEGVGV